MKTNLIGVLLIIALATNTTLAQHTAVFAPDGKAIRGYDPVAYFIEGKPVKGDSSLSYAFAGATWYFASEANQKAFIAQPDQYMPQYGGYCAFGTSRGYKAPTEPDAWTIDNGKLYLNYNNNVRTTWNKDRAGFIEKANKQWIQIKDKP